MTHPVRFGLKNSGQATTIEALRSVWRIADQAGFDHVWDFDHLASIGAGGTDRPVYEGWSLLAAAAEATGRVRIGCLVTGNTYRHPGLLAKIAVTVDHLSGGRLEFGIGAAWAQAEHEMFGLEGLDHRVGRLSESLKVIRSLWTQERTTFEGRYYHVRDAVANPKPIQKPHPPIWIGAGGETILRLVAREADVWNVSGAADAAAAGDLAGRLDAACREAGRDPASIRRSAQFAWDGTDAATLVATATAYVERGFTELIVMLPPDRAEAVAEAAAAALPDLRARVAAVQARA